MSSVLYSSFSVLMIFLFSFANIQILYSNSLISYFMIILILLFVFQINSQVNVDAIFLNGDILLMNDTKPYYASAVAVKNGTIVYVGDTLNILNMLKNDGTTQVVNLKGKTMLPGFIDAHSHLISASIYSLFCDLGTKSNASFADIQNQLQSWASSNIGQLRINQTGWIIGYNYDTFVTQKSNANVTILDQVSTTYPILIIHKTMNVGVMNSLGLTKLKLNASTVVSMTGGTYYTDSSGYLNGIISQLALFNSTTKVFNNISYSVLQDSVITQLDKYLQNGYTTVQDGRTDELAVNTLINMSKYSKLKVEVVAYLDYNKVVKNSWNSTYENYTSSQAGNVTYSNNFRIGGAKLLLDGAIELQTAYFSSSYLNVYPSITSNSGIGLEESGNIMSALTTMQSYNLQPTFHANGDKAIQQLINQVSNYRSQKSIGSTSSPPFNFSNLDTLRVVSIHTQGLNLTNQISNLSNAKIIPSFFSLNLYYEGDYYNSYVLGETRTSQLNPVASALNNSMLFTQHSDYPVNPLNPIDILNSATNRKTQNGVVLDQSQNIAMYNALLSMTTYAAYQLIEQNLKGMINVNYKADFVILSANPLKVNSGIQVVGTVKNGSLIYKIY